MAKLPTFVNVDYDKLQLAEMGDDYPNEDDWAYGYIELVDQGYKVSTGSSKDGSGRVVSITDTREGSINKGLCLSVWGGTVERAFTKAYLAVSESHRLELNWLDYKKSLDKQANANLEDFKEYVAWKRANGKV